MIRCYNPVAGKTPQKNISFLFSRNKNFGKLSVRFWLQVSNSWTDLAEIWPAYCQIVFLKSRVGNICFLLSFEHWSFFQRKCWWFVSSDFILVSQESKCMCQKSETWFFSRTCQEANVMFILLFRSFLAGLELTLHRHMLSQKTSQIRSLLRFWGF